MHMAHPVLHNKFFKNAESRICSLNRYFPVLLQLGRGVGGRTNHCNFPTCMLNYEHPTQNRWPKHFRSNLILSACSRLIDVQCCRDFHIAPYHWSNGGCFLKETRHASLRREMQNLSAIPYLNCSATAIKEYLSKAAIQKQFQLKIMVIVSIIGCFLV